jgi:hypothetical protein
MKYYSYYSFSLFFFEFGARLHGGSLLYIQNLKKIFKNSFRFHTLLGGGKGQDKDGRTIKLVGDAQLHLSALLLYVYKSCANC